MAAPALVFGSRSISGSLIGGLAETQQMLDLCGRHNITALVEVISIQKVNEAYGRLKKADVKYRFSIGMASLRGYPRTLNGLRAIDEITSADSTAKK